MTRLIAPAHATSTSPPSAFFDRWADMATWPEWNADTEWARLDGPFAEGSAGVLKPRGGPRTKFVIERLVPDEVLVDVSHLFGARLAFSQRVTADRADGGTSIDVPISLEGPLGWLWSRVLDEGFRATAQPDLDRLAQVVEADRGAVIAPDRLATAPVDP